MFKNILRSPICGALVTVLLIVVILQIITSYRSAEAQELLSEGQGDNAPLSNAIEALGGLETIQDVKTQLIMAEGKRFEPGQKFEPIEQPLPVSNFSYDLTQNLGSNELRMNWHRDVIYPYPNKLNYSVMISNNSGFRMEKTDSFHQRKHQ